MMADTFKIAILTDSLGNPRAFPEKDSSNFEQTYPMLLRNKFLSSLVYQLSVGDVTSRYLINQFVGYFNDWSPEVIILHAGINDAKKDRSFLPYFLVIRFEKLLQRVLSISFLKIISKLKLLKFRTEVQQFHSSIQMLRDVFPDSKIIYVPIICTDQLELRYLDIMKRGKRLNDCVGSMTNIHFLDILSLLFKENGIASDGMHLNSVGHRIMADQLAVIIQGEKNELE